MTNDTDSTLLEASETTHLENQIFPTTQQNKESCYDVQIPSINVSDPVVDHMLPVRVPFNVRLCREPVTNELKDGFTETGFSKHHSIQWRGGNSGTNQDTPCESNTNLVQWSDGSWTFVINDAYYYCDILNGTEYFCQMTDNETFICDTITEQKITLRPLSLGPMSTCNTKAPKTTRLKPIMQEKTGDKHETCHTNFSHDKPLNSHTFTTAFLENDEVVL